MVRLHHKFKSYQTFPTQYRVAGLKAIQKVLYYTGMKPQQRTIAGKFIFFINSTIHRLTEKGC